MKWNFHHLELSSVFEESEYPDYLLAILSLSGHGAGQVIRICLELPSCFCHRLFEPIPLFGREEADAFVFKACLVVRNASV
ncbi:MAG TPA: hypothetical protein VN673_05615 [Clostridia bacterium]|nr:hypothetical protein [Clostridia bacterium]